MNAVEPVACLCQSHCRYPQRSQHPVNNCCKSISPHTQTAACTVASTLQSSKTATLPPAASEAAAEPMALQMSSTYESAATCVIKPVVGTASKSDGAPAAALKELKLTVQLAEQDSRRQCCCKSDGTRFAGADTTIKLCQDVTYLIAVTTTPAVPLSVQQAEVKHRLAQCEEPSMCCCWPRPGGYHAMEEDMEWSAPSKVPVATRSAASSAGRSAYELAWTCDMELTRSGLRGELVVELAVAEFGVVSVPLMAKVYSHDDSAASHGTPLHSINYVYGKSGLTGEVRMYSSTYNK